MKNISMQYHMLPWELPIVKRSLSRFFNYYIPKPDINIHLRIILNFSDFHTDWAKNEISQQEITHDIYTFVKTLDFPRKYLVILDTDEQNGCTDTEKHLNSDYYDGQLCICPDVYYHKDYLNVFLDVLSQTNNNLTWISPVPDTERCKVLSYTDIDNATIGVSRASPGSYCMGFGWLDYISTSIRDLVGWPMFKEGYGPLDSFTGFVMTELYRNIPTLDYGHYYITGNVIKSDYVCEEDEEYKKYFVIKQNKREQRDRAEKDFFKQINTRINEILERLIAK